MKIKFRSIKKLFKFNPFRGRLYGEFQPGLRFKHFQPGLKILAPNKILISFKMAAQIYKPWLKQLLWQSAILLSLHLQLYGIISIFKLHQEKQNIRVLSYYHAREIY